LGFPTGPLLADRFLSSPHARALCRPKPLPPTTPPVPPPFVVTKTITICATLYTEPIRFLREFVSEYYYPKPEDNIINDDEYEYEYDNSISREELEEAIANFRSDEQQASQKWRSDQFKTIQDWLTTTIVSAFQTCLHCLNALWHYLLAGLLSIKMCFMSGLQTVQNWTVAGIVAIVAGLTSGLQTVQNWTVAGIVAIVAGLTSGLQAVQKWTVAGTCAVQNVPYGLMTRWGDFSDATILLACSGIQILYVVAEAALDWAISAAVFATSLAFRIVFYSSPLWITLCYG
jgi:hypothetical protein